MTSSQYAMIKNHPNLDWVRRQVRQNFAIDQNTLRKKIAEAIEFGFRGKGMASEGNITFVAKQCGAFYGDVYRPEVDAAVLGYVAMDAVNEVVGNDIDMAKALKMVFKRTVAGRTAPGTSGINHIHVGGNAQQNLLFVLDTAVVLGVVDGHMDRSMSPSVRSQADRVNQRKIQQTVQVRVVGRSVVRA